MDAAKDDDFEHLFTPERLAIIDRAIAEADAGQVLTLDEFERKLAEQRADWVARNGRSPRDSSR